MTMPSINETYGFAVAFDEGVERIFVAPELQGFVVPAGLAQIGQRANVATRRKSPPAGSRDDDARDGGIARPGIELGAQCTHHVVGYGVERLWPVERHHAGRAAALEQDVGLAQLNAHR